MLLPGFGEIYVSPRTRLLLALAITLVVVPLVSPGLPAMPDGFLALFSLLIGEIVIGIFLGATARFMLVVLQTTGFLVAQATNLAAAQVFDPTQGTQGTLTGNMLGLMGVLLIFITNLHHMMLGALIRSYEVFPSGATPPTDDFANMATTLVSDGVGLALQLAAPVMLFALIFQVGLGLMARLMPQMHVFFIGMPLQIMLGFAIFAMSLGAIMTWYLDRFVRPFSIILNGGGGLAEEQDQSQKTEEPTHKKLDDARKKGQGVNSREVTNLFMLVAATIVVGAILPGVMGDVTNSMRPFIAEPHLMKIGDADAPSGLTSVASKLLDALAGPLGIFVAAAFAAGLVQRGFNVSTESMKPELKKISPLKGLKRMFSLRSLAEFAKGIAKLAIVGAVGVATIMPELDSLELLTSMSTTQYMERLHDLVIRLLVGVCSILALIAGLDYLYQRYEFLKQMKMSRQEIKDEYKQTEGDPAIKGKIRQLRQERARGRMMAAVPEADVVVTNPTHFSVALKYDADNMNAPTLVAKGADLVAKRIREVAEENDVPIVRNPPLTRALYAAVDLDQEVPVEHYKAVAEVIGYVWRLKGKMRQDGSRAW